MEREHDDDFDAFARGNTSRLIRTAALLIRNRGRAEDLVQVALERTYTHWRTARHCPYGYARRIMVNQSTDWWRRRRWAEQALDGADFQDVSTDLAWETVERDRMLRALHELTARERAVLVLRYYEGLPESEIAAVLRVAPGTVKSTANRALGKLRGSVHFSNLELTEDLR
jgi:RNA polymerase sigma-70 factor (sigma-E family)